MSINVSQFGAGVSCIVASIRSLPQSDQAALFHEFGYGTAKHLSDDALVNDHVAAAELDVSNTTLSIWRCTGRYHLPYVKIGRLVKYRMGDLREFKLSRRIDTRKVGAA
tara:strand:- start:1689 stop:2015 length:327 start_codon:yes stop_codon:yes gene_type:complete